MASLPTHHRAYGGGYAFTHLLALFAGICIGKSIDADELDAYRSSSHTNDSTFVRLRRRMKSMAVTGIVLGLIVRAGRMAIVGGMGGDGGGGDEGAG